MLKRLGTEARRTGRWAPLVLGAGIFLAFFGPASRAGTAAGSVPKPAAGSRHAAPRAAARPLPDTVLAMVADGRLVTVSGFHAAWRQVPPPDRPDTLTPENARKFLDLLIAKEALAVAALKENWEWSFRDSAEYEALRDGLTMKVVLDSALAEEKKRLGPAADTLPPADLGVAARDDAARMLKVSFDTTTCGILARAFHAIPKPSPESSVMAQLRMLNRGPELPESALARPVATTPAGPYLAKDMVATWTRLNPAYRPRIEDEEQVRQAVKNQLFERELRDAVKRRDIEGWPDIAAQLARKREFIAVSHLVAREVYAKIAMDSTTLYHYYVQNRSHWDLPLRVQLARLVLDTREEARRMANELSDPVRTDSLVARGLRAGARYTIEVSAAYDSVLFVRAMKAGAGKVIGPDSVSGGWEVARVLAIEPGRPRTFAECRILVAQKWYGVEGEQLMEDLMARCRKQTTVVVQEKALARLTSP